LVHGQQSQELVRVAAVVKARHDRPRLLGSARSFAFVDEDPLNAHVQESLRVQHRAFDSRSEGLNTFTLW
jgi:hypothetical protein